MFHNQLYRLERSKKKALTFLAIIFLTLSIVWFIFELCSISFPMEPLVVFIGGIATLFASFWPWRPGYSGRRLKGRASCDYKSNDGNFDIGNGERKLTIRFSHASGESIHVYSDPENVSAVAVAFGAGKIDDIQDASALDYSNRVVTPKEGEIVTMRGKEGSWAAIQIHDVKSADRGDDRNEVTFSWVINPDKHTNFAS